MSADGTIYLRVCRYTQISPLSSQRRERLFRGFPLRLSEGASVSFPSSSAAESLGSDEGTPGAFPGVSDWGGILLVTFLLLQKEK